jgi:hypothetical protein
MKTRMQPTLRRHRTVLWRSLQLPNRKLLWPDFIKRLVATKLGGEAA